VMFMIGEDIIEYLQTLSKRLVFLENHAEWWTIENGDHTFEAVFLPRTDPLPKEPSMALPRFISAQGKDQTVVAMVYPDSRGEGYGLSRHNDNKCMDFTTLESENDVHFAHARGFVSKTSATEPERLKQLLATAFVGDNAG